MKKLVIATMLLFAMSVEMQAQTEMDMKVYSGQSVLFRASTKNIDSVVFVEANTVPCPPDRNPTNPIPDILEFEMVYVDGGTKGSITVGNFYIGKYEVTQKLWNYIMDSTDRYVNGHDRYYPSYDYEVGDDYPVYNVNYSTIVEYFIPRLELLTRLTFRLPTADEWQYAFCGGQATTGCSNYSGSNTKDDVAWCGTGSLKPVGQKKANELGLHDMSGNVAELTSASIIGNTNRCAYGGTWHSMYSQCGSSDWIENRTNIIGFRLVLVAP
jgi:formylglycine-generating enzyme required for sulfatase activity